jgi:ethanolamine permease
MKGALEFAFYVSVAVGMALATSSFTVLSGIFQVEAGYGVLLAIAIAGLLCVILSLSVAELAAMYPSAPGIRTYLKPAFGSTPALVLVYLYLVFTVLMAGVEGYMFGLVVANVTAVNPLLSTLAVIVGVTAINLAGVQLPRSAQMAITLCAVVLLLLVSAAGLGGTAPPASAVAMPALGTALPAAVGMAVFLYMGFEWATPVGLRAKSYERLLPLSLPVSVALLMVLYTLFAWTAARHVAPAELTASPIPHAPVYVAVFGTGGRFMILLLAFSATASTFNAGIMGGARLLLMLVNEGLLPKWIGHVSDRSGAPIGATWLLGAAAAVTAALVVRFQLQLVLAVVGAAIMCVVYGAFAFAVLVLRKSKPRMRRPYQTPVPAVIQRGLAVALPLLGVGSLFSLPALVGAVLLWTGGAIAAALFLTWWSTWRAAHEPPAAELPV